MPEDYLNKMSTISSTYYLHKTLHGASIVDYALEMDIMRKSEFSESDRTFVQKQIQILLNPTKN